MNYFEELKRIRDSFTQKKDCISYYTYLVFRREVLDKIPCFIEESLDKENAEDIIHSDFELEYIIDDIKRMEKPRCWLATLSINGNRYENIECDEFAAYMEEFCHRNNINLFSRDNGHKNEIKIPIEMLINYYYEELQREEFEKSNRR